MNRASLVMSPGHRPEISDWMEGERQRERRQKIFNFVKIHELGTDALSAELDSCETGSVKLYHSLQVLTRNIIFLPIH